ncbi:DNA oxidative demethylase AlkB [Pseudidiomarina atlantica]|nr:DNA oxidative demethylase AlkB [Pseudidiomarina atlantica]
MINRSILAHANARGKLDSCNKTMQEDLFDNSTNPPILAIGKQSFVLKQFADAVVEEVITELRQLVKQAPFRQLQTPGGQQMSVQTTCCGSWGWHSDRKGYRYVDVDPVTQRAWPAMPVVFAKLAQQAAVAAGFAGFSADSCLINRYLPGTKMGLHRDQDERDFSAPIVSVSLGLPATFLWGGLERKSSPQRIILQHGDVVVWGGADRLRYHGVMPLADGHHPRLGRQRVNLTFRKAGD